MCKCYAIKSVIFQETGLFYYPHLWQQGSVVGLSCRSMALYYSYVCKEDIVLLCEYFDCLYMAITLQMLRLAICLSVRSKTYTQGTNQIVGCYASLVSVWPVVVTSFRYPNSSNFKQVVRNNFVWVHSAFQKVTLLSKQCKTFSPYRWMDRPCRYRSDRRKQWVIGSWNIPSDEH